MRLKLSHYIHRRNITGSQPQPYALLQDQTELHHKPRIRIESSHMHGIGHACHFTCLMVLNSKKMPPPVRMCVHMYVWVHGSLAPHRGAQQSDGVRCLAVRLRGILANCLWWSRGKLELCSHRGDFASSTEAPSFLPG